MEETNKNVQEDLKETTEEINEEVFQEDVAEEILENEEVTLRSLSFKASTSLLSLLTSSLFFLSIANSSSSLSPLVLSSWATSSFSNMKTIEKELLKKKKEFIQILVQM